MVLELWSGNEGMLTTPTRTGTESIAICFPSLHGGDINMTDTMTILKINFNFLYSQ